MDPDFLSMLPHTVTIQAFAGVNRSVESGYGTPTTYRARFVRRQRVRRTLDQVVFMTNSETWIYGAPGINPKDKITLPDGAVEVILLVERYPDEAGEYLEKVFT